MKKDIYHETIHYPKILVVGINAPYNKTPQIDSYYEEFLHLIKTYNIPYEQALFIKLRSIDPAYFLTKGKLEELKKNCEQYMIEQVIFSDSLTSQQIRNLADFLNCSVFDRTELILEIFEKAAVSSEGKMQVAIAKLQHQKSRLAGKGIHLSQQSGAIGVRGGPGETAKEKELRHIEHLILKHKKDLKKLQSIRETQRKYRIKNNVPHLCLIGYTNAGKSTLLNMLTKSNVLADNKLFATLDTTTRELYIHGEKKGIISDTVGFIQQLPPRLIEAFKSTLSELEHADLLLHVIDLSDSDWQAHITVVSNILKDLKINKEILYVFNKSDRINNNRISLSCSIAEYQPYVIISAQSKESSESLIEFLADWKQK
jgi:GTPase